MTPLRGILFKVISVTIFITMASLIKATADTVPPGEAVFFRSFFALPVIIIWLAMRDELQGGLKTQNPVGHLWRGVIGSAAMGFGFAGLGLLPLPEVTAIGYAAPILVVIFAAMFLGEEVRIFRMSAVGLGLLGVMIVLAPRFSIDADRLDQAQLLGAMFVLSSAVFAALAQVFVRKLVQSETTASIVFWFSVTAASLSLLTLPWGWVVPAPREVGMLILAGLLGGLGQIFLTSSYRLAPASLIAPFEYTSILLAILVGYVVFDEVPTRTMLIGAVIVMCAGALIIWREWQLGLKRKPARKAMPPAGT